MQTTANLWEILCRDYESERQRSAVDETVEISRRFLAAARRILRQNSVRLCDAMEIAGDVFQASGHQEDAQASFEEALAKARLIGAVSSRARLAAKLSFMGEKLGSIQSSIDYGEEALAAYESLHDFSQHIVLLNHLGGLSLVRGNVGEGIRYYQRAVDVASHSLGGDHPETATAMNNYAVALMEALDFVQAENYHMQSLAIREKNYGAVHPEVAQSLANMAVLYHSIGNYAKAGNFYRSAIAAYRAFRRGDEPDMQALIANYESLPSQS